VTDDPRSHLPDTTALGHPVAVDRDLAGMPLEAIEMPLAGIRILDFSDAMGAYCTRLLADLGADVVKVEPPAGDPMRRRPPFEKAAAGGGDSLLFAAYHANKRGVTLDRNRRDADDLRNTLARTADVIVLAPTRRSPIDGLDAEAGTVAWAPHDAVVCAVTPFGLTGPWRDFRATAFTSFAMSGGMHRVGPLPGPPVAIPGFISWDEAGIHAAVAVLAALEARPRCGGQLIDLSAHEVAAGKDYLVERYDVEAMVAWGRTPSVGYPPSGTWQCADGPFEVACHQVHHWDAFLAMLDQPQQLSDPSLSDPVVRRAAFDTLKDEIAELMRHRSREDLFEKGQAVGLPCCPQFTPLEFVDDPQPLARAVFAPMTTTALANVRMPWAAFSSSPPLRSLRRPAPSLGQHNREVYVDELGFGDDELVAWRSQHLV
jgi:crotonobetainyl-CoA:carnitine CoA-transferase CaiB-like acyl-CoA transferase